MIELNGLANIARNIAEARQKNGAKLNVDTASIWCHASDEYRKRLLKMKDYEYSQLKQEH